MVKYKCDKRKSNKIGTILIIASLIPLGISASDYLYLNKRNNDAKQSSAIEQTINEEYKKEENINDNTHNNQNNTKHTNKFNFEELKKINPDIIGVIEGSCFEGGYYPVVSSKDYDDLNNKLYQNLNGEYSTSGLIIADPNNDDNLNGIYRIWGHHLKGEEESGLMFSSLVNYDSEEYYQNHKELKYYTENGEYILEVYACTKDNPLKLEKENMYSYIKNIKESSLINTNITPEITDKQIVLTTCTRAGSKNEPDLRISVHTKVTPIWEKQIEKGKTK